MGLRHCNYLHIDRAVTTEHNPSHVLGRPSLDQMAAKPKFANFPKGDTRMKYRIGFVVVLCLSLILLLVKPTVQAAAPTGTLTLSGAAFICANQVETGSCPDAEFDPALGSIQNGQGTWAANVALPPGAVVTALKLCGQFNEVGSSITATLDMAPITASSGFPSTVAMASVASTGAADKTQCFATTKITSPTIHNGSTQYFVVVVVPDNDGVIFTSVQIEY